METTTHGWTILDRDAGVLCYEYNFSKTGKANAFVARMADKKLLVVSPATRLSSEAHADLEEFGEVGAVVAPNGLHHLGIADWRERYPNARFFAPAAAISRIGKKNPEAGALEPLSILTLLTSVTGPDVHLGEIENTKCGEIWAWAQTSRGAIWFASDMLANMPQLPKSFPIRMMFKLSKSGPGYRVFALALMLLVKDRKAAVRQLASEMDKHPPVIVVPAHGGVVDGPDTAEQTKRLIADYLG